MSEQRETREMQYQLSRKLLDLMLKHQERLSGEKLQIQNRIGVAFLKNGFLEPEEYAKIDTLNRSTFSPELAEVYA